jgi:hypothetical protein
VARIATVIAIKVNPKNPVQTPDISRVLTVFIFAHIASMDG